MAKNEEISIDIKTVFDTSPLTNASNALSLLGSKGTKASSKINGLTSAFKMFTKVGTKGGIIITTIVATLTALILTLKIANDVLKKSVKAFSALNKELINARALTGATIQEMAKYTSAIREMARSTTFTALEISEGFTQMTKMGLSYGEALNALPSQLSLAMGAQEDVTSVIAISTKTMKSFNLEAKDMAYISDVLAVGVSSTALDVRQFGAGLQYLGSTSESVGVSLETMTVHLGIVVDKITKASRAGRLLRNIYAEMAGGNKEVNELLAKTGSTATSIAGRINDLTKYYENNADVTFDITEAQRLFGREAADTAIKLMNSGKSIEELTAKIKDHKGASKAMADIQMTGLSNQWLIIKSYVFDVYYAIGEMIEPIMKVATVGGTLLKAFEDTEGKVGGILESFRIILFLLESMGREGGYVEASIIGIAKGVNMLMQVVNQSLRGIGVIFLYIDTAFRRSLVFIDYFSAVIKISSKSIKDTISELKNFIGIIFEELSLFGEEVFSKFNAAAAIAFAAIIYGWKNVLNHLGKNNDDEVTIWDNKLKSAKSAFADIEKKYKDHNIRIEEEKAASSLVLKKIVADDGAKNAQVSKIYSDIIYGIEKKLVKDIRELHYGIPSTLPVISYDDPKTRDVSIELGKTIGNGIKDGLREALFDARNFTKTFIEILVDEFGDGNFLKNYTIDPLFGLSMPWMNTSPLESLGPDFKTYESDYINRIKEAVLSISNEIVKADDELKLLKTGEKNKEGEYTILPGDVSQIAVATDRINLLKLSLIDVTAEYTQLKLASGEGLLNVNGAVLNSTDAIDHWTTMLANFDGSNYSKEFVKYVNSVNAVTKDEADKLVINEDTYTSYYTNLIDLQIEAEKESIRREAAYYDSRKQMYIDYTSDALTFLKKSQMEYSDFDFTSKTPSLSGAFSGDGQVKAGAGKSLTSRATSQAAAEFKTITNNIVSLGNRYKQMMDNLLSEGFINVVEYDAAMAEMNGKLQIMYGEQESLYYNHLGKLSSEYQSYKESMTSAILDSVQVINDQTFALMNTLSSAQEARDKKELDDWKRKEQRKIEDTRLSTRARGIAEDELATATAKREKEMAKERNKLRIAEIWSSTAMGIAGAWAQAFTTTAPAFAPIIAGISTGLLLANAGAQTANIHDGFATGGIVGATMGNDNTTINARNGEMVLNADQQGVLYNELFNTDNNTSRGNGIQVSIENFSGNDDDLTRLEDMLYSLQSNGRINNQIFA